MIVIVVLDILSFNARCVVHHIFAHHAKVLTEHFSVCVCQLTDGVDVEFFQFFIGASANHNHLGRGHISNDVHII